MPRRDPGKEALQPKGVTCELWKNQLAKLAKLALVRVASFPGYLTRGNSHEGNSGCELKKDNSRKDLVFSSIGNNLKNTDSTLQGMGWHWPLARMSRPGRSDGYIYPTRIRVH